MELRYTERFRKAFRSLSEAERQQVRKALKLFLANPRHPSLRLARLTGYPDIWYIRASRDLRITLQRLDDPADRPGSTREAEAGEPRGTWILRVVGHHDRALGTP